MEAKDLSRQLKDGGITVIDARGPDEFTGPVGHIGSALNLPARRACGRLMEVNARNNDMLILVCQTDTRSAEAATLLRTFGFRDARVLRGGMGGGTRGACPSTGATTQQQDSVQAD